MTMKEFPKVTIDSLVSWGSEECEEDNPLGNDVEAIFSINKQLNDKLYFWKGHILSIAVDVIVNTTNETLNEKTGASGDISINGGQNLVKDISKLDGCRTGEAKITRSHSLPHNRFVIHTVGPRYNVKYETAAENALHSCYRTSLQLAVENKLRTIAIPPINTPIRGYPRDLAAHLSLITIRKFLDKFGDEIDKIVFVFDSNEDLELYRSFARYYFPRTTNDLLEAKENLPEDYNNTTEFGEKIIPEREIRIAPFPAPNFESNLSAIPSSSIIDDLSISELNSLEQHPDDIRRIENSKKTPKQIEDEQIERIYQNYLTNTKNDDLTEIARMNIVYQSEQDHQGRPIIVFVGANFPNSNNIQVMKKLLAYIIRTLHSISGEFVVVYLHAGMSKKQQPDFAWIQLLYKLWERKFTERMANLYLVHPSFWVKFILTLMKPFVSQTFTKRMIFVTSLTTLFNSLPSTIRLPDAVYTHDQQVNRSTINLENPKNEGL